MGGVFHVRKRALKGISTQGFARFPCICGYGQSMKRAYVCVSAWKRHSGIQLLLYACLRACACNSVQFYENLFVCPALTNWRNTCPSAWWGWGSGNRLYSTADNTPWCSLRMSSIFENRIYKMRGWCKGRGYSEEGKEKSKEETTEEHRDEGKVKTLVTN